MRGALRLAIAALAALLMGATSARADRFLGPPVPGRDAAVPALRFDPASLGAAFDPDPDDGLNPIRVLDAAGGALPGSGGPGREGGGLSAALNIMVLLTVITLVPSIMLMTTCFVRIVIVLGLLRQAMGTSTLPPPQVIMGLALFMTVTVMSPTIDRIYTEAVVPYQQGQVADYDDLWKRSSQPLRDYMFDQMEATGNWSSLYMLMNYRGMDTSPEALATMTRSDVGTVVLIPAYMLSELKTAFLMGFRVYLPFLVIDMVISSLLISMSMMMLPPVMVSLPFKLLLFVLVDGWQLIVGSLMSSFVQDGAATSMAGLTPLVPPDPTSLRHALNPLGIC
jgi:flagellar biosynthetic protein FliP